MTAQIPTIQKLSAITEAEIIRREKNKKRLAKPQPKVPIEDTIYSNMLNIIINEIESAARQLITYTEIKINSGPHETVDNQQNRVALNKAKTVLRSMGYQTCWKLNIVEDDGFDRGIFDIFCISWEPDIKWNEFRD